MLLLAAGCGDDNSEDDILSAGGWPGIHADARNSDYSPVSGARALELAWTRPTGGPVTAYPSISKSGQMFVTSNNETGCNLYSFVIDNGRKRYCNRQNPGLVASTPTIDGETNAYVGESGAMWSYNYIGQPRWRTPVVGTPISAQFTPDGNLLFVTQLGYVYVLSRQTGDHVASPFALLGNLDPIRQPNHPIIPDNLNLPDCFAGTAGCPVANTPAMDIKTGTFYTTVWRLGAPTASLVALQYSGGADPKVKQLWSADMLEGGSASSPDLSADGKTVYVNDNRNRLWALDTSNGQTRWIYDLGYTPLGSQSTSPDGLIIPAAGRGGHLVALRDKGDRAEVAWERKDLTQLGVPAQTSGNVGYTVVGTPDALSLLTFDTSNGNTLDTDPLPGAKGFTIGTAVGPDGEVVTATAIGELFVFKPHGRD